MEFFRNYEDIANIVREIAEELGHYMGVTDWNRKEYLRARIRAAVKNMLMKVIDERASYDEIDRISKGVIGRAEAIYVVA